MVHDEGGIARGGGGGEGRGGGLSKRGWEEGGGGGRGGSRGCTSGWIHNQTYMHSIAEGQI
jgi:hypothetical protein